MSPIFPGRDFEMPWFEDEGEVSTDGTATIRWTIHCYTKLPQEVNTTLGSPWFTFRGEWCRLVVRPNGWECDNTEGWVGIQCVIFSLPRGSTLTCCMLNGEGSEILLTGTRDYPHYDQPKWILRTKLKARREEILPGGRLIIVCRVVLPCEPDRCAQLAESGVDKLLQNLKDMFVGSKDCDFLIRVRGREFHVHRCILKARIPAFDAMLSHDMAENKDGVVSMDDCDPDVFNEFLLFVYSGRVENLSPDNVCGLYVLAEKYDLQELKDLCRYFMKTSLSVQMICDVISLAVTHGETELLKLATDFFAMKLEQILETEKGQLFLQENPTEAKELFMKSVKIGKAKRTTQ